MGNELWGKFFARRMKNIRKRCLGEIISVVMRQRCQQLFPPEGMAVEFSLEIWSNISANSIKGEVMLYWPGIYLWLRPSNQQHGRGDLLSNLGSRFPSLRSISISYAWRSRHVSHRTNVVIVSHNGWDWPLVTGHISRICDTGTFVIEIDFHQWTRLPLEGWNYNTDPVRRRIRHHWIDQAATGKGRSLPPLSIQTNARRNPETYSDSGTRRFFRRMQEWILYWRSDPLLDWDYLGGEARPRRIAVQLNLRSRQPVGASLL